MKIFEQRGTPHLAEGPVSSYKIFRQALLEILMEIVCQSCLVKKQNTYYLIDLTFSKKQKDWNALTEAFYNCG